MKEYEIKDKILEYMQNQSVVNTFDMANDLKIEHELCLRLLRKMHSDNFVKLPEPERPTAINNVTKLFNAGVVFLENGGYTAQHRKQRFAGIKKVLSQIFTSIIAVATVVIAFWQAHLSDRTNKLEDKNERLQQQVDSLIKHPTIQKLYFPANALKQRDSVPR